MPLAKARAAPRADEDVAPWVAHTCAASGTTLEPASRQGSSVTLVRRAQHRLALAADPDLRQVHVVDVAARRRVSSQSILGKPEQVLALPDGRVIVSVADRAHLEIFTLSSAGGEATLERLCAREVPPGPFGLAVDPGYERLAASSGWSSALSLFSLKQLALERSVPLARSARGVLFDDPRRVLVSHLVGAKVSLVELSRPSDPPIAIDVRVRAASQQGTLPDLEYLRQGSQAYALTSVELGPVGAAGESPALEGAKPRAPLKQAPRTSSRHVVVPMVSVDPGDPSRSTRFYYGPPPLLGVPKQAPTAVLVDPLAQRALSTRVVAPAAVAAQAPCLLPRAVVASKERERLFVACLGLDQVQELDARSADPMRAVLRRFEVPQGPTGVAIEEATGTLLVNAAFAGKLAVIELASGATHTVELSDGSAHSAGRELFYRTGDANITAEGLACSSCHPDGGDDGVTWSTPEGLRQTPMLAGRLQHTAPYGWTRRADSIDSYLADTMSRLGGQGLRSQDRAELARYVSTLASPPRARGGDGLVEAGRLVWNDAGCGSCHRDGAGTDAKAHGDSGAGFDTPALRDVGRTAPYFHDGRYPDLESLLADDDGWMPGVSGLGAKERGALLAYLRTL